MNGQISLVSSHSVYLKGMTGSFIITFLLSKTYLPEFHECAQDLLLHVIMCTISLATIMAQKVIMFAHPRCQASLPGAKFGTWHLF